MKCREKGRLAHLGIAEMLHLCSCHISGMKWFNTNDYEVEGHVVLHLRQELPKYGEQFPRS